MKNTKFKTRNTTIKAKGIFGEVHCSVCYCNDESNTIAFTQHRKNKNGELEHHFISLYKNDLKALVQMLKENEMI